MVSSQCKIAAGMCSVTGWQAVEPVDVLPGLLHHPGLSATFFYFMLFAVPFGLFC